MKISRANIIFYIVAFVAFGNLLFGHSFANILILNIPLNVLFLLTALLLILNRIPQIIFEYKVLTPLIIWSIFFLMFHGFSDAFNNGLQSLRAAHQNLDALWILVSIYLFSYKSLSKKLINFFYVLVMLKILSYFFVQDFGAIYSFEGRNKIFFPLKDFLMLNLYGMLFVGSILFSAHNRLINFLTLTFIFYIIQSRVFFLSIILIIANHIFFTKKFIKPFLVVVLSFFFFFICSYAMSFLNVGTNKYDPMLIAGNFFDYFLYSIPGRSELFSPSSQGLSQRLMWANDALNLLNHIPSAIFGVGFNVALTDHPGVHELHNSYLTQLIRSGFVGFILWFYFHLITYKRTFLKQKNRIRNNSLSKAPYLSFVLITGLYLTALVEPVFELPSFSIIIYLLIGYNLIENNKERS